MEGLLISKLKRERDTLQDRCDALQAMVGSLELQLALYAEIMSDKHRAKCRRKRLKS